MSRLIPLEDTKATGQFLPYLNKTLTVPHFRLSLSPSPPQSRKEESRRRRHTHRAVRRSTISDCTKITDSPRWCSHLSAAPRRRHKERDTGGSLLLISTIGPGALEPLHRLEANGPLLSEGGRGCGRGGLARHRRRRRPRPARLQGETLYDTDTGIRTPSRTHTHTRPKAHMHMFKGLAPRRYPYRL